MAGHNWLGIIQPKDASKPAQPGGCAQCHVGLGAKPNPVDKLTEADLKNIDCLICHGPNYKRVTIKEGDKLKLGPAPGVDILKVAKSVQRRPTNEMCLRCHAGTGGGLNHKHGVIPTKDSDIHTAKEMICVDCHITKNHKFAGGSDLKVHDLPGVVVACTNCHKEPSHKGKDADYLNMHTNRIACNTCHIPVAARDPKMPTMLERDYTKPVFNEVTGLYGPANKMASNVKPEYLWWNRMMKTPPEPVGSISDPKSKIYPWKRSYYTIIADAETGKAIYIKAGVYAVTGDPGAAAKKGAEDSGQKYSGKWKGERTTMVFSMNHQVAPKTQALKCIACHSPNGVMDFKKLGYSEDQVKDLTTPR